MIDTARTRQEASFEDHGAGPRGQRREHPRYSVDLDVSLGSDHNFYAGFAENLSAGGVFIATHVVKPVGERIEISIRLPDREAPIEAVGEVRWTREFSETSNVPPGLGVRFVELKDGALEAIAKFLQAREPLFWDDD
jgi:uncharacterized protein (TIGR02266 family)